MPVSCVKPCKAAFTSAGEVPGSRNVKVTGSREDGRVQLSRNKQSNTTQTETAVLEVPGEAAQRPRIRCTNAARILTIIDRLAIEILLDTRARSQRHAAERKRSLQSIVDAQSACYVANDLEET